MRICTFEPGSSLRECVRMCLIYWPRRFDPWNWKLKFRTIASTCHFLLCISGDISNRSRKKMNSEINNWQLLASPRCPSGPGCLVYCCSLIDPQTVLAAADKQFGYPEYACKPAVPLHRTLPMFSSCGVTYRRDEGVNNAIIPSVRLTDPFCWPGSQ